MCGRLLLRARVDAVAGRADDARVLQGGQGDARVVWDAIVARSRRQMSQVWSKLERYYEEHGHLRVPMSDPDLGHVVNHIRSRKDFLHHADLIAAHKKKRAADAAKRENGEEGA